MKEFIAYDTFNDVFYKREDSKTQREFLDKILSAEEGENGITYHDLIKTDDTDEHNKIYADSSIFEFDCADEKAIGYFIYDEYSLSYVIVSNLSKEKIDSLSLCHNVSFNKENNIIYQAYKQGSFEVIGTLQEKPELLK